MKGMGTESRLFLSLALRRREVRNSSAERPGWKKEIEGEEAAGRPPKLRLWKKGGKGRGGGAHTIREEGGVERTRF